MKITEQNIQNVDQRLKKGSVLYTLSYQTTRTRSAEMFYAIYDYKDLEEYLTMFNGPLLPLPIEDLHKELDAPSGYKYVIENLINEDILVACETSAAAVFAKLVLQNEDFRNFVLDRSRMQSYIPHQKYVFRGYSEARKILKRIRASGVQPDECDLFVVYRLFNYIIPAYGGLSAERADDLVCQRDRFLMAMQAEGYDATVDTNDAIYGGFHADTAIIVFNSSKIELLELEETTGKEKQASAILSVAERLIERY